MSKWALTEDLSDTFFTDGASLAKALGAAWLDVLGVMFVESGVSASQANLGGSGAGGLIQFAPATLVALGWQDGPAAFLRLSADEQLPWVHRFFAPYRGKLDTLAGVYCCVWMPADIDHRNDKAFVLSAKGGRRGWAYEGNAVLDANGDLSITVGELEDAVRRGCVGPRWEEIRLRADPEHRSDLRTVLGLQQALALLGFEPGPLDGVMGAKTRDALRRFQASAGLVIDGIPGPRTREALGKAFLVVGLVTV